MNQTKKLKKYYASLDTGECGETEILAQNNEEAWQAALEWALDGDWPEEGCITILRIWNDEQDDYIREEDVKIPQKNI